MKTLKIILSVALAIFFSAGSGWAESIFAPLGESNQIARFNKKGTKVEKLYGNLESPHGLAITPNGKYLYSASLREKNEEAEMDRPKGVSEAEHETHHGGQEEKAPVKTLSFITKLDAATGKILRRINVGKFTHHVTVTPDGKFVIGVQSGAARIVIINASTDKVLKYIPVGKAPNYALVTKDSKQVFISSAGENALVVIDGKTWRKKGKISVGKGPEHMAFSPDEKEIYAVNVVGNALSFVNTQTLKETKRVATGQSPHGVGYIGETRSVVVANRGDDTLSVYSAKGEPTQVVPMGPQPYHVAVEKDSSRIWVSSRKQGEIWLIAANSMEVQNTLKVPGIAHQIVISQ